MHNRLSLGIAIDSAIDITWVVKSLYNYGNSNDCRGDGEKERKRRETSGDCASEAEKAEQPGPLMPKTVYGTWKSTADMW
jgi:hypothetical protein